MRHFVHGRAHEHVAAFFAKSQVAVATGFGRRDSWSIIHIDVLGKIRVLVVKINRRIHHGRNTLVGIQLVFGWILGLMQGVFNGRKSIARKASRQKGG